MWHIDMHLSGGSGVSAGAKWDITLNHFVVATKKKKRLKQWTVSEENFQCWRCSKYNRIGTKRKSFEMEKTKLAIHHCVQSRQTPRADQKWIEQRMNHFLILSFPLNSPIARRIVWFDIFKKTKLKTKQKTSSTIRFQREEAKNIRRKLSWLASFDYFRERRRTNSDDKWFGQTWLRTIKSIVTNIIINNGKLYSTWKNRCVCLCKII